MQNIKILSKWLDENCDENHYLFSLQNFWVLFPGLKTEAFKTLLSRSVTSGLLARVCKGIYMYAKRQPHDGNLLCNVVNILRPDHLNYLSLESRLSELGIISQIPISRVTFFSTGRSGLIDCGVYGVIEFIHTRRTALELGDQLEYDSIRKIWVANVKRAINDSKQSQRSLDLIDWSAVDDVI